MSTPSQRIAFIGAGNMAKAIIGGLIENGTAPSDIAISASSVASAQNTASTFNIQAGTSEQVCQHADIVVLAVKPAKIAEVTRQIADHIKHDAVLVSIAAGVTCDTIAQAASKDVAIIRAMPNTPSLVKTGATGVYANNLASDTQKQATQRLFEAVGICCWVAEEAEIDLVTAISGSGPAYFFQFMESMIAAAKARGMSEQTAAQLTLQTALGAATLACNSDVDVTELRQRVTSPNGTTEKAILHFQNNGINDMVDGAVAAAQARAQELAKELA